MLTKQYELKDELFKGSIYVVNNAEITDTGQKCVIKQLVEEYSHPEHVAAIRYEYELLKKLKVENVIKALDLITINGNPALVEESIGGRSIKYWMDHLSIDLKDILHIMVEVTNALAGIHAKNVIHKDVNPSNIVWNPKTGAVKLIDFNSASELPEENLEISGFGELEGTMAYISPEQTGRISRGLNYRTDFYSLGVTFFEMATGQLPFQTNDPMEMLHFHIAKEPPIASEINKQVPAVISDIILKCMQKSAEDRYQSAFGLLKDLNACFDSLQKSGRIEDFKIATGDAQGQLNFSGMLYGREKQIAQLLNMFEQAKKGSSQLLLVAGYSGVGKTSLVSEMRNQVAEAAGYFIHGKCDQFNKNIPYYPFIEAIKQLMQKVLVSGDKEINAWKTRILDAVGNNGTIVTEMIPILEKIIGKQPEVPILDPNESRARTEYTLINFLLSLSSQEKPLAIFIDDLQWADPSLLNLMKEAFRRPDFKYTMLIGAYRNNEVDATHPLMLTLKKIEAAGSKIETIDLPPLEEKHVHEWIAAILRETAEHTLQLSEIIFQKTLGNAFFVIQLIKELKSTKELIFDYVKGQWNWSIDKLKQLKISANVVDLMVEKINRLSPKGLKLIQVASCIGNRFDVRLLATANKSTIVDTLAELQELLQAGFILPIDDSYKYLIVESDEPIIMRFQHDKVQQASHSTIEDGMKKQIHYDIGRLLNEKMGKQQSEEQLLEVVEHLNYGSALIKSDAEKHELIKLNLRAGRKANQSNAYDFAIKVLEFAIHLLPHNSWQQLPELTDALYLEAARSALLTLNMEKTEALISLIIQSTKSHLSLEKAYRLKVLSLIIWNKLHLIPETIMNAYQLAGISIKINPAKEDLEVAIAEIYTALQGKPVASLEMLPMMTDPLIEELIATTSSALPPICNINLPMGILLSAVSTKLSIQYGNCGNSCMSYANMGLVLWHQDNDTAIAFSNAALKIQQKMRLFCSCNAMLTQTAIMLLSWVKPNRVLIDLLKEGYQSGIELGEFVGASWCLHSITQIYFLSGMNLEELLEIAEQNAKKIAFLNSKMIYSFHENYRLAIENLIGKGNRRTDLYYEDSEGKDYKRVIRHEIWRRDIECLLCYIFQELNEGKQKSDLIIQQLTETQYITSIPIHYIFRTLTLMGLYPSRTDDTEKIRFFDEINANFEIIESWKRKNFTNIQHLCTLCLAEKMRLFGDKAQAEKLFLEAIQQSRQDGFQRDEAIALEALARFYLAMDDKEKAKGTMIKAHDAYRRWGAKAKTADLENKYREYFADVSINQPLNISGSHSTRTTQGLSERLDLASAMKAASLISGEIYLNKLIPKMLNVMIENAGAQRALFIEKTDAHWEVAAKTNLEEGHEQFIMISQPLDQADDLPKQVIEYVQRTKEAVVLADAIHDEQFGKDPYIKKTGAKSILCMPIEHKDQLVAITFFENNLNTHVFTQDRIQILRLLGTQAAISLENARHFEHIQRLYNATERFVPKAFLKLLGKEHVEDVVLGDSVKKSITVLFNDIRSFTTLVENRTPEDAFAFVNRYWEFMAPIIRKHNGYIDQYLGDAIMAIFPEKPDDAVLASIDMMHELENFNAWQREMNDVSIQMGIGISTGLAMLGIIGEKERQDSGLISDVANTAARIEGLNKVYGSRILISAWTANALTSQKKVRIRKIDQVRLKGKMAATEVYEVIEWASKLQGIPLDDYLRLFNGALGNYSIGQFAEAKAGFQKCLIHYPEDKSAETLLQRCVQFLETGIPKEWDGIYTMTTK